MEYLPISELFDMEKGVLQSSKCTPGPYPFITAADEWKTHKEYSHDKEALLFAAAASGSLGRTHYVKGKFIFSDLCFILTPKDPNQRPIDLQLYQFIFQQFQSDIVARTKAGTSKESISQRSLGEYRLPYISIDRQKAAMRKMVAVRAKKEALTTELTHQRALLKQLRQAILDDAVLGVLDGAEAKDEQAEVLVARIAERKRILISKGLFPNKKRTERYRSTFGSELPKHWTTVELGDVTNIITSGSRGWAEFYSETGPKFIRAQNIRFGELLTTDLACVTPPRKNDGQRTLVERDDLFVVITGAGVSTPARLNDDIGEAYVSQHVALIKPTMPETSEWLLLCLMAPMACRDVLVSRAYGAGKPGLNLDNLRTLVLPFPPLEEQRRILAKVRARLGCLDGLESEVADSELVSSTILQSVLSEVMGGPGVVRYAEAGGKLPLAAEPQVRQGRATKATSQAGEGQLVAARWQKL